ncbi:c-type cytochrome domain-containing protein [uncultured Dokdonia sp.]|uniref:c-type cytochrome domain-containing protein n=1 Tax=uncultured Dokdonia sp. TaxID=575653 RepID=UPI002621AD5B|nr:c-type cytochrome domain-containing protein [uncultured Dokdonia sp.]
MNSIGFILILCMFGFTSCERSSLSELTPELEEVNVVTYENTARAILDNACVECHNVNEQTAGVRLDAYDFAFIEADNGRMLARMTDPTNPMPPSGNLPDNLIQGIIDWVDDGILENEN